MKRQRLGKPGSAWVSWRMIEGGFCVGETGAVEMQTKVIKKGRLNPVKYCADCEEATVHSTGSQLWISCSIFSDYFQKYIFPFDFI